MPDDNHNPRRDRRASIPNRLTLARLAITVAVIAVLALYDHPTGPAWALPLAAILFVAAALTDTLDGYLARRWNVVSRFGRIMDPFADKALVLGSFIMLAGPGFTAADGRLITGLAPWMVVLILARELLVTSLRGVMESIGVDFSATWTGKGKMILQSVVVPLVLTLIWLGPRDELLDPAPAVRITIESAVWLTVIVTVLSGIPYVKTAIRASRDAGG